MRSIKPTSVNCPPWNEDEREEGGMGKRHTSSKQRPLSPIHSKHTPSSEANTLRKVDTPPEIHSQHASSKVQPPKVKDSSVTYIR